MLHAHPRAAVAIPLPKRIAKQTRTAMEAAIEQHLAAVDGLVALLDLFDGDADMEPSLAAGGSLHSPENDHQNGWGFRRSDDDREGGDVSDEGEGQTWIETHGKGGWGCTGANDDDEPSLAHTLGINQTKTARLGQGWSVEDGEQEHDGREPDEDREPSLGSLNCIGPVVSDAPAPGFEQTRWAMGESNDLEEEHNGREPDEERWFVPAVGGHDPLAAHA